MKVDFVRAIMISSTLALAGCATAHYPTEVIRFHAGDQIGRGRIALAPFQTPDGAAVGGAEFELYAGAVAQQLTRLGWSVVGNPDNAEQVALIGIDQERFASRRPGPVSIGVGGGTGGWSSGVGAGVGFNLGGGPREVATMTLNMRIKQRADDRVVWEGRATKTAPVDAADASPATLAPRLAEALFQGFPGESGRTIRIP